MELFHRGGCLDRTGVFRGLCERDCVYQSFWNVAFGGYFADTGGLVYVGMQKIQGIMLTGKVSFVFQHVVGGRQ